MIVVTGNGRTGTSLMMQTLKLLGMQISGVEYLPEFGEKKFNPKGFFNLPLEEIVNGIPEKYKGTVVKADIISLQNTDPKLIDLIIVCKRNINDMIDSMLRVMDRVDIGLDMTRENLIEANTCTYDIIEDYAKEIPTMYINYEEMISTPKEMVEHIAKVLDISNDIGDAIKNIDGGSKCQ
jgi:hypothetical protein